MSEVVAEQTNEEAVTDVEKINTVEKKKKNSAKKMCILSGTACLIFQIILFGFFTLGGLTAYNRSLNPLSAIEFFLDLFSFLWMRAQQLLLGLGVGVAYYIVLVVLIVRFVSTCKTLSVLGRGAMINIKERTHIILQQSTSSFQLFMLYAVAVCSITASKFSVWIAAIMILMAVVYVFGRMALRVETDMPYSERAVEAIGYSITMTVVGLLYWYCQEPIGANALSGLSMLFGGFIGFSFGFKAFMYTLFCNLIEPALNIALVVIILKIIARFFTKHYVHEEYHEKDLMKSCRKGMIYAAVILGLQFVCRVFFSFHSRHISKEMFSEWFLVARAFNLPVFLLLVAFLLIFHFVLRKKKQN